MNARLRSPRALAARPRRLLSTLLCGGFAGALVCGSLDAHAAGIALDLQSARGTGMATAMTAFVDDSSAIFYNPAGIARGRALDVEVGDTIILPSFRYTSPSGDTTHNSLRVVPPFQIYESGGVTDHLSLGIGVFMPYGLTLAWPANWAGKSLVTESSFATYDFNPTVAYSIGPFRIGAGAQLVRATVDNKRAIATGPADATLELGAATWGFGGNVGVQVDAIPRYLSIGAHYRSAVKFDFDGDAHFGNVPVPFAGTLRDQRVTTSLTTPHSLQMGLATRPVPGLVVDVDVVWYSWATFRSLDIQFPGDATKSLSQSEPKNWKDVANVHLGVEDALDRSWRVRAGVMYDPTPSPRSTLAPDVPDADRLSASVGGSYVHPCGFRVDLGYEILFLLKRTSTYAPLPGEYQGIVNIIGVSLGYQTPRP